MSLIPQQRRDQQDQRINDDLNSRHGQELREVVPLNVAPLPSRDC